MSNEIRYFSMFTGVGGFELGLEYSSNRNVKCSSEEKDLGNSKGNKSISERQQNGINNSTDNGETQSSKDTSRTLFQNRQEQSNTFSSNLESTKRNIELGQQIRQTSDGILREGNGIRDDKENMEFGENSSNFKQFQCIGFENSNSNKGNTRGTQCLQSERNSPNNEGDVWESNENNKFKCIGFSEIDKYASQLLANKWPTVKNWGDCTKINPSELPDFDMLCGGFPCQSFSIAGKRRGFEDTRGTMFFHIARILKIKRPKLVFLENVKGLLNHNKGETFKVIIQTLEELGYRTQWMVLNSKFFGVPQNRERVFIIGSIRGTSRPEILPFRTNGETIIEQVHPAIDANYYKGQSNQRKLISQKGDSQGMRVYDTNGSSSTLAGNAGGLGGKTGLYAIPVLTPDRIEKRQNGRRFKENGEESFTITKTDIHGVAIMDLYNHVEHSDRSLALTEPHHNTLRVRDGLRIRRLTPTECERLQGFPDGWTEGFSDTQRYKMMGNAVTVNVIKAIGDKLLEQW